ncbi:hypothetical protein B0H21DRAFT_827528 [Amylocystis lapponica]|nr:hypothetical protein B0H21DRAFT_827528 [Amylocystis lapponica]
MSFPRPNHGGDSHRSGASSPELPRTPQIAQDLAFHAPLLPPDARDSPSSKPPTSLGLRHLQPRRLRGGAGPRSPISRMRGSRSSTASFQTTPLVINNRDSVISSSGASVYTLSSRSKHPAGDLGRLNNTCRSFRADFLVDLTVAYLDSRHWEQVTVPCILLREFAQHIFWY